MSEHFKAILTVQIVAESERDKFRNLSRPETYRRIRPHEAVGERGCYEVEVTPREFTLAMRDALNPDSNLIAAERAVAMETHLVPNQGNRDYAELRRLSEDGYDASGVAIAVIDRGITTAFRDAHFAGRVADAEDFTGEANPYALYSGDEHGCYMASLAIPPESDLVVAKVNLTSDVAESFYWIADETTAEIVSISLATSTPSVALADAVDYARDAGLLIFASAGNDGNTTVNYPSSYDGAHKISNFDHRTDAISPDSTFGADVFGAAGGNDHIVWNATGSEFYIEAGGTSCATAMAARIAAYVVGKFGSGSAISTLTSTARDAGAPSNKQGAGVLRLVHSDDREPPIPVVPTGQSRDFDLQLPELPPIDGPEATDPEDPAGSGVCSDSTLVGLVDDFTASGSDADRDALIDYVESVKGASFASLMEPERSEVLSDGTERDKTIRVSGCRLTFTLSRTGTVIASCDSLPEATMPIGQHTFSLPTKVTASTGSVDDPNAPNPTNTWGYQQQMPDATVNVSDPEMVWVTDADVATRNGLGAGMVVGGTTYYPAIRIRASYTAKLSISHAYSYEIGDFPTVHESVNYQLYPPLLGLHRLTRYPAGSGLGEDTADPIQNDDYNRATAPSESGFGIQFTNNDRWLRQRSTDGSHNTSGISGTTTAEVQDSVDVWNADGAATDPTLSLNTSTLAVTADYTSDENALYFPFPGCSEDADPATASYYAITLAYGSWVWQTFGGGPSACSACSGAGAYLSSVADRYETEADPTTGRLASAYRRLLPGETGSYALDVAAADLTGGPADGEPPLTTPNPPIVPVGGGCRSSIDGPSSCSWNIPDNGDIPLPGDDFDGPVVHVNFPKFPPIGCHFPDFGNMDPCGPGSGPPGHNGPLPGGRDRRGKRGRHHGTVKTGGKSYGNPRKVMFSERTCFGKDMPGISCFTIVTMLLMDCGISALDIIWQVTAEWDKPFPANKCFRKGSRKWDAAEWTARYLGLKIIDEGKPTNNIYIGPPWHRPGQNTWHFYEHIDFFGYDPVNSSDELYGAVEVFGPNGSAVSIVDSPFVGPDSPTLLVEVGPNHSQGDMNLLAAYKASLVRREATGVQVTAPYSPAYFLRDKALLHAPDRGFETTWIIVGKESDISVAGRFHILTLMLPETVRELDELPTSVANVSDEIPGTEFEPS